MKIIAHRGNLSGSNPECENNPTYIQQAIDKQFDCEIDIWFLDNCFFLGHDSPVYYIDIKWLVDRSKVLWCHAKNIDALVAMKDLSLNYFWHESDKITLTSYGIPWCYPGTYIRDGITVDLGIKKTIPNVYGVCTDHTLNWL